MARMFRGVLNETANDDLILTKLSSNYVDIDYTPSQELLNQSYLKDNEKKEISSKKYKLLLINGEKDLVTIFPINTLPTSSDFLKAKYETIESISLEGFGFNIPDNVDEVIELLEELPSGFVKNYEYGLGLLRDYRTIISSIEEISNIKHFVITKNSASIIKDNIYYLHFKDYEAIRKGINRISRKYQKKSLEEKVIFSNNALLDKNNPIVYSKKSRKYRQGEVKELIDSVSLDKAILSPGDSSSIISLLKNNKSVIYKNNRSEAVELKNDIELLNLSWLVNESERLLSKRKKESEWQAFFDNNPFILFLVFGYPVIKIQDQASVGGRKLSGCGDKITDFLVKNHLSNNCALIEIKKPSTELLVKKEYRGGVYSPSHDLTGSVIQILDQKYKLQKEISMIKDNSGIYDIESYAIDCVLIIGSMPEKKDEIKSFELLRNNFRDVRIFTFDEIVHKLRKIYTVLKEDSKQS